MESLIPVINKLQDVFNTIGSDSIQLPQIVVVGTQSSGKSSVLENIVGRSFLPRGTGIVTRTPLVLQLVHTPKVPGPHRREDDGTVKVEEYGRFLHADKIFTDFDEIRSEIEMQTKKITGTRKGISEEVISLKIFSPTVVNLTLVDLPGLTKLPVGDQPHDIETKIRHLVLKYIRNPNSIIMAVVTANTDMATNESLKLAKDCDPNGDRTLAVVTKLDLMDAGTDATDILSGRVIPVKLGIIGVINRSQNDIVNKKPISEALKDESAFLHKKYPSLADCNGTPYLSKMLKNLLMRHIKYCLPDLKHNVYLKISENQAILTSYGVDVTDKNQTLLDIITRFSSAYSATISGCGPLVETKELVGGARICYIFHETFKTTLGEIDPLCGLTRKKILTVMRNATGPKPALFIPELAFELLVKNQIQRLREPSLSCAELVHEEMRRMVQHCCSLMEHELLRFPSLRDRMVDVVFNLLRQRTEAAHSMIENQIAIELAYINPRQNNFDKQRALLCKPVDNSQRGNVMSFTSAGHNTQKESGDAGFNLISYGPNRIVNCPPSEIEENDCKIIENLIVAYFTAIRWGIQDSVPKSIMHFLVNFMRDNLQSELIRTLYKSPNADELLQEAKHVALRRQETSKVLKALHEASSIINEIRDLHFP